MKRAVLPPRLRWCLSGLLGGIQFFTLATGVVKAESNPTAATIDFGKQIRPILSNACFQCHGPDANERQAELRLDLRDGAINPSESGKPAIVPGKPDESPLLKRIHAKNKNLLMPPAESNKSLTEEQKGLLKAWIEQGAKYETHWSFTPPTRPSTPKSAEKGWVRNTIDRFILAKLDSEGLKPAPEADRTTLIRRLSLDLTGLPPTPAEVDAFVADPRSDAYDRLVDRMLNKPQYGERLAVDWLDAARYADTHGYHIDSGRDMTRWRDWVIESFNRNRPFDQFSVEQLAGDLLPNATMDQRIASGFNRNHMINFEGGAIPEEYQTAYVIDRVNTTGTVWLGLTIGCAQCHDHKFDPISQKEYYQFYAFFNNIQENGLDGAKGNAEPQMPSPTIAQQEEIARLDRSIADTKAQIEGHLPTADTSQVAWEKTAAESQANAWQVFDPAELRSTGGSKLVKQADGSILAEGENPTSDVYTIVMKGDLAGITAVRLETLPDDRFNGKGPGRSVNGNIVLTEFRADTSSARKFKGVTADHSQADFPVALAIDGQPTTGWALLPEVGKPHAAVFEFDKPLTASDGQQLTIHIEFQSPFGQHQLGRFRLATTRSAKPTGTESLPAPIVAILGTPNDKRTPAQLAEIRTYFRFNVSPETKPQRDKLANLQKFRSDVDKSIPTTMVMSEMAKPRDTFMLIRGAYDKHGEKVTPAVPASLPALGAGVPANRLGLARWIVDPSNPLPARVTINRYWQMIFGTGLVKTSEDFGSQGELPSHPELLDWLALEFQDGWNVREMIRMMVTSATYRQSSVVTPESLAKDPENRLLSRGPRLRLQAEFIRDLALSASGLLDPRIGGMSVSPYQPPGLWEELSFRMDNKNWTAQSYEQSHGRDLYRRTMYTFWKRTSPPPTLATFDAPDRETCTVRRARTNTPLQALVLLNDPTYVEAARKLAERMMVEGGKSPEERINLAYRLALSRAPRAEEVEVLKTLFEAQAGVYRKDNAAAVKLLTVGESGRNAALATDELAAWTMVAAAILNLDETVTKG
ncbi:PSD1 and planctomycete cytochrome C domain-containing protein [Singulisphaera sp. PoT]|uniref:PSD1 and planctomycete cytochrome C domain-containing protein n=1 Tax=Singulisphaera sp. PoT TaxID=3411797 RepID=UPI003BF5C6E0